MKKVIYRILLVLLCISYSHTAKAFVFFDYTPLVPVAPQICAMCTPSAITEVATAISQVNDMRLKFKKYTDISKIKQALASYAMGIGVTTFNNLRQKLTSKKKVSSSSIVLAENPETKVDLKNQDAVKEVMIERFFQYPSDKNSIKKMYEQQGEQLKIDTTIEIYVNVRKMEQELNKQLEELDKIERCISGGDGCEETGMEQYNCQKDGQEDEMCLWRNSLTVANIYDMMMRNIEYLSVLEAQYEAVLSIGKRPEILKYVDEKDKDKDKQSSILDLHPEQDYAHSEIRWNMSFAEQSVADEELAKDWYDGSKEKEVITTDDGFEVMDGVGGFEGSLSGKKEDFRSMPIIEEAMEKAEMAKRAHNMKQNLRSAKKVFDSYEDMLTYHDKIVENLRISEKCIQNYMREYYQNPLKSWTGKDCGYYNNNIYCHYSPEKSVKNTSPSKGIMDIPCPGMEKYHCYLLDMTDTSERYGLSGYTLGLYLEAKKQEALSDQDAYLLGDDTSEENISDRVEQVSGKLSGDSASNNDGYITTRDRKVASNDPNKDTKVASQQDIDDEANADRDQYDNGGDPATLKKPSIEEAMEAEARKDGLLNWTIGAVVSKAMVDDLSGASNFSFGAKKKVFPLWNDQREFYDQYLEGKYGNIRDFFSNEPFEDLLLDVSREANENMEYEEDPLAKEKDAKAIEKVSKELEKTKKEAPKKTELEIVLSSEITELKKIHDDYEKEVAKYRQNIKNAYTTLDRYSEQLDKEQAAYNDENSKIQDANQTTPRAEVGIAEGDKMYEGRSASLKTDKESPIKKDFEDTISGNEDTLSGKDGEAGAIEARESHRIAADNLQAKIKELQNKIKGWKKDIEKARSEYVFKYSHKLSEKKQAADIALENQRKNGIGTYLVEKSEDIFAMGVAKNIMQCVRQYALEQVGKAEEEIDKLRDTDELYYASNIGKLREIHNNMIKAITEDLDVEEIIKSDECGLDEDILEKVATVPVVKALQKMFSTLCKDNYCTTPESEDVYFVGAYGKRRDFKTPTAPVNFASAPLRDIFHFDTQDYDNVDKYTPYDDDDEDADLGNNELVTITGESLLNLGGDLPFIYDPEGIARNEGMMPKIWYYILKPLTFEEREFDLLKLVERGAPSQAYLRSGIYPCLIEGRFVRASEDFLLSFVKKDSHVNIQECRGVTIQHGEHGMVWPCDNESKKCGHCDTTNIYCKRPPEDLIDESSADSSSELATIIDYIPDPDFIVYDPFFHQPIAQDHPRYKLTFNPMLQQAIQIVNNYQNEEDDNGPYHTARRSLLDRNQFGDYLDNIDTEAKATEVMANLSQKIEEIGENLEDIFNAFGYTLKGMATTDEDGNEIKKADVSDDFSLLNPSDYKKAMDMLEDFKTNYMRNARTKLSEVPVKEDEATQYIKDELEKVNHILQVLEADSDEDVLVSGDEDLDELKNTKIKESKANEGVGEEYEKKRKEDLNEKINKLVAPYCTVFVK